MKNATRLATLVLAVGGLGILSVIPSVAKPTTQPSGQPSGQASPNNGDATGNCTISGTVTKDGKPLANAKVALFVAHMHSKRGKTVTVGESNNGGATTQPSDEVGKKKHDRGEATATATSDADGKFTLTNVPAGRYVVVAGLKGDGHGHEKVVVSSGESTSVEIPVAVAGEKTAGGKKLQKLGI